MSGVKNIIETFLTKKSITPEEVGEIINKLEKEDRFTWRDLGDLENNYPRVHIVSSPKHTIVERVTNAIDACIERKSIENLDIRKKNNIWEVEQLLTKNKLWNKGEVKVEVFSLHDIKKTNFLITDKGIGIENERIPYSILDLNSKHKKEKNYLLGSFGQGGSTVCRYSNFTIIITTQDKKTSFTIIRDNKDKEKYEYLVDKNNIEEGYVQDKNRDRPAKEYLPPFIDDGMENGTCVIHIGYEFHYSTFLDYWKIFDENLFNSFLPYRLYYLNKEGNKDRPMNGLKKRLENHCSKKEVEKNYSETVDLGNGEKAKIVYYYIYEKPIKGFLDDAGHPIFVTLNGQSHARLRRGLILDASLSKLKNRLIIEINCNFLSKTLKRDLFTSDRQKLQNKYEKKFEESIISFLETDAFLGDEQLRLEEEERKEELDGDIEEYRQELATMIEDFTKGKYKVNRPGSGGGSGGGGGGGSGKELEDIYLQDTPSYLKIDREKDDIDVPLNQNCNLKLETDLSEKSFIKNKFRIEPHKLANKNVDCQIPGIKGGRTTAILRFKDVNVGDKIPIQFFLKSKEINGVWMTKTKYIHICGKKSPGGGGGISIDAPDPKEVYRDGKRSKKYEEFKWGEKEEIAKIERGSKINIYVNMSHSDLERFLEKINEKKIVTFKRKYFLSIALASFLQSENEFFKNLNEDDCTGYEDLKEASMLITAKTLLKTLETL